MTAIEKYYTTETRLNLKENYELAEYLSEYITFYNTISRYVWRQLMSPDFRVKFNSNSKFNTHICQKYNLLKRTANSIINETKGKIKTLKALKKYELTQLKRKVKSLEKKKRDGLKVINALKPSVRDNKATKPQLDRYIKMKTSVYYTSRKLNKKKNQLKVLKNELKSNKLKMCFGTKKLYDGQYRLKENDFKSHEGWYNTFVKNRDKNIFYLGSKDEPQGNQILQLRYDDEANIFIIKLRKEKKYSSESKYIQGTCDFKYQKEYLKERLKGDYPLTYRIIRRGNKWYLQGMVIIEQTDYSTRSSEGVFGLDYNVGFIEISETNKSGNLIWQKRVNISTHGTSNKAKNELRTIVKNICTIALEKGKDITIEDLNFKGTKGKTIKAKSKSGKSYNRMIHRFDYSRYKETFIGTSHKLGVGLILVNPRNTSKIGQQNYSKRMKLNTHQAASFVIARRGQGFKDKLA